MTSKYPYRVMVSNSYLGLSKEVKGMTSSEVEQKAAVQIAKWDEREQRNRSKKTAAVDTQADLDLIEKYKSLLSATLSIHDKLDWEQVKDRKPFSDTADGKKPPELKAISQELGVPRENSILEWLFKSKKEKRIQQEAKAKKECKQRLSKWEKAKAKFEKNQKEYNATVDKWQSSFEEGHGKAIEKYISKVLDRSQYPEGMEDRSYDIQYDPISQTVIIAFELPSPDQIPRTLQHTFIATRNVTNTNEMKPKEFASYYEDVLYQICLRTMHEVFESVYIDAIKSVVFNGWITGADAKTGKQFHSCVISCMSPRNEFFELNLSAVNPKECFRHLKGISAGPLIQLAPVCPVMDIKRNDSRFIESREVLDGLESTMNLATMEWADFEHLVRDLFEKVFSTDGGEVKVTQSSRDRGVDAIAFDPDPIKGGKFVIQAKRYNIVVPVAAVRDLYGTMINEGATKGILVTTSYYGNDSREFAKDKPIALIDGANLVYLFQEHGHNVTIELQQKSTPSN